MSVIRFMEWAIEPLRRVWLVRVLLAVGVLLQLAQYVSNRSLWLDEAMLALNIIERPFAGLLGPLEYDQAAPAGFLFVEHLAVLALGTSEYVLRLFPLIAGIVALFAFRTVSERVLSPVGSLIAMLLFVASDRLIYFASEVKPYSSDVAVALLLWLMATREESSPVASWRWGRAAIAGAAAVWFSYPAIFVLAAIGMCWLATRGWRRQWWEAGTGAVTGAIWLASFWALYALTLKQTSQNQTLLAFWAEGAAPLPPRSYEDLRWYLGAVDRVAAIPLGQDVHALVLLASILGGAALFANARERFCWLVLPGVMALLASGLHKYPLATRLWLFMVPALLLLAAAGVEAMWERTRHVFPLLVVAMFGLLWIPPMLYVAYHLARPQRVEETRPLLQYWRAHRGPTDTLYVYYEAVPAVRYYALRRLIEPDEFVRGVQSREAPDRYLEDLGKLQGRDSVWLLFSHSDVNRKIDEEEFLMRYLDRIGRRREERRSVGASLYLYDLSGTAGEG